MNAVSETYRALFREVYDADEVAPLLNLFSRIRNNVTLTDRETSALELAVFRQMRVATAADPASAADFIAGPLVGYCLTHDTSAGSPLPVDIKIDVTKARELLHEWIEQYDEHAQGMIIAALSDKLWPLLRTTDAKAACLLFSAIGYRDDSLTTALVNLARVQPEMLTYCVDTLASCGAAMESRALQLVTAVLASSSPRDALYALNRIAPSTAKELILAHFSSLVVGPESDIHTHVALSTIARIASRIGDDQPFHDNVWSRAFPFRPIVLLDGQIASSLNSPSVVPDLLSLLAEATEIEPESMRVWRIAVRLQECVKPRHLASWRRPLREDVRAVLHRVAIANSGPDREAISLADRAKEYAWHILISSGDPLIPVLLNEAITSEESGWVQEHVMRAVSCLVLPKIPQTVLDLIEVEFDCPVHDHKAFAMRSGAIAILRGTASYRAFQALLKCKYTYDGSILLDVADALAESAQFLHENHDTRIVPDILKALSGTDVRQRELAARALAHLATPELRRDGLLAIVMASACDTTLPGFVRSDLISVLTRLRLDDDAHVSNMIASILDTAEDERVLWQCCMFLIRSNAFEQHFPGIVRRIGWNCDNYCETTHVENVNGWRARVIAELFVRDPSRFTSALIHVLRNCDDDACYQLSYSLHRDGGFPIELIDLVEDRIVIETGPYCSPSYLFKMLGTMDYRRLLAERIVQSQRMWTIDAKVAWLHVLSEIPIGDVGDLAQRIAVFDALAGDSALQVRRAANRAIRAVAPDTLTDLWRSRTQSDDLQMRLRGAETVEFLPAEIAMGDGDHDMYQLRNDRFRSVRTKCEEAMAEAARRDLAESYIQTVTAIVRGHTEEMIEAYPYGLALVELGDSETIAQLSQHLNEREPPPNVYNWIQRIIRELRHKARDDDAREVGHGWDAIVEHFTGRITIGPTIFDAECNLWRAPQVDPGQLGTWGGTVVLREPLSLRDVFGGTFSREHVAISGPDREPAKAVVTRTKNMALLVVSGSGNYPTLKQK